MELLPIALVSILYVWGLLDLALGCVFRDRVSITRGAFNFTAAGALLLLLQSVLPQ